MRKVLVLGIIIVMISQYREGCQVQSIKPQSQTDTIIPVDTAKYLKYRHRAKDTRPYKGNWVDTQ